MLSYGLHFPVQKKLLLKMYHLLLLEAKVLINSTITTIFNLYRNIAPTGSSNKKTYALICPSFFEVTR